MYYSGLAYPPYSIQQFSTPRTISIPMQQPIQYCTPSAYRSQAMQSAYCPQQIEKPLTIKIHMSEPEDNNIFPQYATPFRLMKKQKSQKQSYQFNSIIPQTQIVHSIAPQQVMMTQTVPSWQGPSQTFYRSEVPKQSKKGSFKFQKETRQPVKQLSLNFDINNFEKRIQALDNRLLLTLKQSKEFTHSVHKDMRENQV